jgi:hypothetical protein
MILLTDVKMLMMFYWQLFLNLANMLHPVP